MLLSNSWEIYALVMRDHNNETNKKYNKNCKREKMTSTITEGPHSPSLKPWVKSQDFTALENNKYKPMNNGELLINIPILYGWSQKL